MFVSGERRHLVGHIRSCGQQVLYEVYVLAVFNRGSDRRHLVLMMQTCTHTHTHTNTDSEVKIQLEDAREEAMLHGEEMVFVGGH